MKECIKLSEKPVICPYDEKNDNSRCFGCKIPETFGLLFNTKNTKSTGGVNVQQYVGKK